MKTAAASPVRGFTGVAVDAQRAVGPGVGKGVRVSDLLFVLLTVALFGALGLLVKGGEKL